MITQPLMAGQSQLADTKRTSIYNYGREVASIYVRSILFVCLVMRRVHSMPHITAHITSIWTVPCHLYLLIHVASPPASGVRHAHPLAAGSPFARPLTSLSSVSRQAFCGKTSFSYFYMIFFFFLYLHVVCSLSLTLLYFVFGFFLPYPSPLNKNSLDLNSTRPLPAFPLFFLLLFVWDFSCPA